METFKRQRSFENGKPQEHHYFGLQILNRKSLTAFSIPKQRSFVECIIPRKGDSDLFGGKGSIINIIATVILKEKGNA